MSIDSSEPISIPSDVSLKETSNNEGILTWKREGWFGWTKTEIVSYAKTTASPELTGIYKYVIDKLKAWKWIDEVIIEKGNTRISARMWSSDVKKLEGYISSKKVNVVSGPVLQKEPTTSLKTSLNNCYADKDVIGLDVKLPKGYKIENSDQIGSFEIKNEKDEVLFKINRNSNICCITEDYLGEKPKTTLDFEYGSYGKSELKNRQGRVIATIDSETLLAKVSDSSVTADAIDNI